MHVILVHGNSMSRRSWDALLTAPALKGHSLRAIDLPGHGHTPRLPDEDTYTLDLFARHVADIAKVLPEVVLVGHSLGGHVCAQVPARAPSVLGMVIFGAPLLRNAADAARAFHPAPALAKAFTSQLAPTDARELAEALTWPGSPAIVQLTDDILRTDPRVRGDIGTALASGRIPDEVAGVKQAATPVRIVHGADDPFIRTDYLDQLATELNAGPVRILADAGHSPQVQAVDALAHEIADFLERLVVTER